MKKMLVSRRSFFKLSLLGAGALALPAIGLASVAAAPSQEALAAAQTPQGPAIPQPTFNAIAASTTFGALTDISMGWDGTLWGIDAAGKSLALSVDRLVVDGQAAAARAV